MNESKVWVFALQRRGVTSIVSTAWYQRMRLLSRSYPTCVLVEANHKVAPDLEKQVVVKRSPRVTSDHRLLGRTLNAMVYLAWSFLVVLKTRLQSGQAIAYTHHGIEALVGAILAPMGCLWIADVLDAPDLYLESAVDFERDGQLVKAMALRLFVAVMRRVLRSADLIITIAVTPGDGLASVLQRDYEIPAERILPVTNGIDLDALLKHIPPDNHDPTGDAFRIFYVGAISHHRGIDTVLNSVAMLSSRIPNLEVVLAGPIDNAFRRACESWLTRPEIGPYVRLLGRISNDEVLAWIRRSQICLFPFPNGIGLDETIPIKVLEYLALKRAVIASDLPGVRHILWHGENGLLVRPSDAEQLAAAIWRLYSDPELRERLAQNAHKELDRFAWSMINKSIEVRLNEVIVG